MLTKINKEIERFSGTKTASPWVCPWRRSWLGWRVCSSSGGRGSRCRCPRCRGGCPRPRPRCWPPCCSACCSPCSGSPSPGSGLKQSVFVVCPSSSYYYYYHYISASLSVQCTIQRNSAQARAWRWPQHKTTDYILWLVAAAASHHGACNNIFTTLPCCVYEYEGIQSLNLFSFWHNVQAAVTSDALHPGDNLQISFITSAASSWTFTLLQITLGCTLLRPHAVVKSICFCFVHRMLTASSPITGHWPRWPPTSY